MRYLIFFKQTVTETVPTNVSKVIAKSPLPVGKQRQMSHGQD